MGIQNLLKELRPITKSVGLDHFRDQKCGVDASCWLHRASHSCALDLVSGRPTTKYLQFTLRCIRTLQYYNITPIIVFDGAHLPMKANEEHRRNQIREDKKKEALRHIKSGNKELAYKAAASAVRITKQMVTGFINQCIGENIQFICAPYEADSQLGYMYKNNQIDFVITEDSDLLLFGVQKALYKLDLDNKCGDFVNMNEINNYKIHGDKKKKNDLCLFLKRFWTKDPKEFIQVCVLSGCDYVKNLAGIGIKTAVKYCNENRNIENLLEKLLIDKVNTAPNDYEIQFNRAVLTFLHQRVYDIHTDKLIHLNPLTDAVKKYSTKFKDAKLDFLGKSMDADIAKKIAKGMIDARDLLSRNLDSVDGTSMDSKEQSEIVEDEFCMDLTTRRRVFTLKHWQMLWQYDPDLYQERYQTKQNQEKLALWQKWMAIIQRIAQDGNCICVAMLKDLGIETNSDTLMVIRKLLNKYCKLKIPQFTSRFGNDVEKFLEDKILLEEDHYFAYNQLFRRNVIILEYHEEYDDCSMKIWFDPKFVKSLYLLYSTIPKSDTCAGHIDHITMPEFEFNLNDLGLKCGFNYIGTTQNYYASEETCLELNKFDIRNQLPHILMDYHTNIYGTFGKEVGNCLLNTNIFPIKHLLEMAQAFNLSASNFDGNVDESIQQLCDYMNQYYNTHT